MKKLTLILLALFISFSYIWGISEASANNGLIGQSNNLYIGSSDGSESPNLKKNDKLKNFNENDQFIEVVKGGGDGLFNTLIRFARDLKNLFYAISAIFFLIISLKLIFATNTEEELGKFKKGIIWITIWLIVMQVSYAMVLVIFDAWVSAGVAFNLTEYVIMPLIVLLETLVSIFFIAIAALAFYSLVTANGNEEAIKNAKNSIIFALIGFMIVRFSQAIVEAFYGRIDCQDHSLWFITIEARNCVNKSDISEGVNIIVTVINWLNGFIAIVVLLMLLYAGSQILLSAGDEEKVKKWKQNILYVAIWLGLLSLNYLILTFFLRPESII